MNKSKKALAIGTVIVLSILVMKAYNTTHSQETVIYEAPKHVPTELEIETERVFTSEAFIANSHKRAEAIANISLKSKHEQQADEYRANAISLLPIIDNDVDSVLPASQVINSKTKK